MATLAEIRAKLQVAVAHAREVLPGGLEDLLRALLQRHVAEGLDAEVAQALRRGVEEQALVPGQG